MVGKSICFVGFAPIILIGVLLVGMSVKNMKKYLKFFAVSEEVTAVVIEVKKSRSSSGTVLHDIYIDYEFDGTWYRHKRLEEYERWMEKRKQIKVNVNRNIPDDVHEVRTGIKQSVVVGLIGAAFPTVILIFGLYFLS